MELEESVDRKEREVEPLENAPPVASTPLADLPIVLDANRKDFETKDEEYQAVLKQISSLKSTALEEIIANANDTAKLYNELTGFESSLLNIEQILLGFQYKLGELSNEIQTLQNDSTTLTTELKNSKEIEENLQLYLNNMDLSQAFIGKLLGMEIGKEYIGYLRKYSRMIEFTRLQEPLVNSKAVGLPPPSETHFVDQIASKLLNVTLQVVQRIKDYFMVLLQTKNVPQLMGKETLDTNKAFVDFLRQYSPHVFAEVKDGYLKLVSRILLNYIDKSLMKLAREHYTNLINDVSGASFAKPGLQSQVQFPCQRPSLAVNTRSALFNNSDFVDRLDHVKEMWHKIGEQRKAAVKQVSNELGTPIAAEIIAVHQLGWKIVAFFEDYLKSPTYFTCESVMESYEMYEVYVDKKGSLEHLLLVLLFGVAQKLEGAGSKLCSLFLKTAPKEQTQGNSTLEVEKPVSASASPDGLLDELFRYVRLFLVKRLKPLIVACFDILALSASVAIINRVGSLPKMGFCKLVFSDLQSTLQSQINAVIKHNLETVDRVLAQKSELSYLPQNIFDVQCSEGFAILFSDVVLGYACSRVSLKDDVGEASKREATGADIDVEVQFLCLVNAYLEFLQLIKEKARRQQAIKSEKTALVFMINNLQVVESNVLVLQRSAADAEKYHKLQLESNLEARDLNSVVEKIRNNLLNYHDSFVESTLMEVYGKLISFLKAEEQNLASQAGEVSASVENTTVQTLTKICAEFKTTWKGGLKIIFAAVDGYFLTNKKPILKQVYTQLLLYYSRFQELLKAFSSSNSDVKEELDRLVPMADILKEIKKYDKKQIT